MEREPWMDPLHPLASKTKVRLWPALLFVWGVAAVGALILHVLFGVRL